MSQENGIVYLWNLPSKYTYVKLESNFNKRLFDILLHEFKTWKNVCIKFNFSYNYFNGRNARAYFKPLEFFKRISEYLSQKYHEFSLENIEKKVLSVKWKRNGKPVLNPKFPIDFNSECGATVISGFLHDGSIKTDFDTKYTNLNKDMRITLTRCMKTVFGNVSCTNSSRDVLFPPITGVIMVFGLGIREGSKTISDIKVPSFIKFSKDRKVISVFIGQAICDEGSISISKKYYTRVIKYGTSVDVTKLNPKLREAIKDSPKNYVDYAPNLVKDTMFILNEGLGIKTDGPYFHEEYEFIDKKTGQKHFSHGWYCQITGYKNLKRFQELITLVHPKKRMLLSEAVNSITRIQVRKGTALLNTLKNAAEIQLSNGFVTAQLLAEKMGISLEVIQERLKRLKKQNLLKVVDGGYKEGLVGQESFKYVITPHGFIYLEM